MDSILKILGIESFAIAAARLSYSPSKNLGNKSVLAIILVLIIFISYLKIESVYQTQKTLEILQSKSLSVDLAASSNSTRAEDEKSLIQNLLEEGTYYSYRDVSRGFMLKHMNYFGVHSKENVEKKILDSLPLKLRAKAAAYIRPVLILSEKHQVDPIWILSVMWTESHFKPRARSSVGAQGLMQIMPKTKSYVHSKFKRSGGLLSVNEEEFELADFFNMERFKNSKILIVKLINIELGIIYLKSLLDRFNLNHQYATVAYNMGPTWTKYRLNKKLPVGNKNVYLAKVKRAYIHMVKRI